MNKKKIDSLAQKLIITVTENYRAYYREEITSAEYGEELERIKERFHEIINFQSSQSEAVEKYQKVMNILCEFPDLQDGRCSSKQLRKAADEWYWDRAHPLIVKYQESLKGNG